jgi:hypothetical protein
VEAEILLRNFMLERLLERIAVSDYKHNFILKRRKANACGYNFTVLKKKIRKLKLTQEKRP